MDFIMQYSHYIDAKKNLQLTFFCILNMNILKGVRLENGKYPTLRLFSIQ